MFRDYFYFGETCTLVVSSAYTNVGAVGLNSRTFEQKLKRLLVDLSFRRRPIGLWLPDATGSLSSLQKAQRTPLNTLASRHTGYGFLLLSFLVSTHAPAFELGSSLP